MGLSTPVELRLVGARAWRGFAFLRWAVEFGPVGAEGRGCPSASAPWFIELCPRGASERDGEIAWNMSTVTNDIVAKLWNLCNVLKDDGAPTTSMSPN